MRLSFYGAAGEVTGSCSLLETDHKKILIDCGAFQGGDFVEERNNDPFVFDASKLSAVIVTHAHLDHIGRLPMLIRGGYGGFIYATPPTVDLVRLVLEDALDVMAYNNKKYGSPILYTSEDVNQTMSQFKAVDYYEKYNLSLPGEKTGDYLMFYDAGHIFGSAFVEVGLEKKKIVFSGDLGNVKVPILRDTDKLPSGIDLLICESTYGGRLHESVSDREGVIKDIIKNAMSRNGVLLVPAFSVERTQEILYDLNNLIESKRELSGSMPIFLDSPLAIEATGVFNRHTKYFDEEAKRHILTDDDLFNFPGLTICRTKEESMKINGTRGPKIIIAGAGMMNGGRILHHAMRYLSDPNTTLFFTGFQAPHTLGRKILEGESPVNIFGQSVSVKARVEYKDVMSGHADRSRLFDWVRNNGRPPKRVILNHGDPEQSKILQDEILAKLKVPVSVASPDEGVDI